MRDYWINKAIREAGGSAKKLAQKIGVSHQSMSFIRNHAKKIPLEIAIKIEIATSGAVSRFHLADHLDPKIKRKLLEEKPDKPLRISEQGMLALAYEKMLGNRKGTRSDLQPRENFPQVKGRTEEIAAEYGGFGNYKTYRQFKKINQSGCLELIMAMDNKRMGISTAAKLADLPPEEQCRVLQLTKKEIVEYVKNLNHKSSDLNKKEFYFLSWLVLELMFSSFNKEENNMARIRTVKPELFKHDELFEAEQRYQLPLRLAFIGLFTCCDREGRFRWRPKQLKLDILPYDNTDMSRVLDALATSGFIVKYEITGEYYGYIPSWSKHQCINNREAASNLPSLEKGTVISVSYEKNSNSSHTPPSPEIDASHTCTCMHQGKGREREEEKEGKGTELEEEGSGKEKEVKLKKTPEAVVQIFDYWKSILQHPKAVLDKQRQKCIRQALAMGYSVSQLCQAIEGCSLTPHNMGNNDRGERFDGLHIIFKSADQIDRFIQNAASPPRRHVK